MTPLVRLAEPDHLKLIRAMEDEYYAYDHLTIDADRATAAVWDLLSDRGLGRIWLIFDGDAPAGYLILCFGYSIEFGGRDAFIDEFYLREPYRSRGWGRHVLGHVATAAAEAGVRALHLEVTRDNARVLRLYRSVGFIDHDRYLMTRILDA